MNAILELFNTEVSRIDNTITVTYCHLNYSGTCIYEECLLQGTTKKFKQKIHILTKVDMDDVIEYMYKNGGITGPQDLQVVSKSIQDHSRKTLEATLQDPHQ